MLVLIAVDDPAVKYFVAEIVESAGHESIEAEEGHAALQLFGQRSPHLVISDVDLPGLNGFELLEACRRKRPDMLFILMSGRGMEETACQAMEAGATNYLTRPLRFETLLALLDKYAGILKSREMRREVISRVIRREVVVRLENRLDLVSETADFLVAEAGDLIAPEDRSGVHLGLYELLVNAIEHGNLGINFDEKRRCLLDSPYRLSELVQRRLVDPKCSGRVVTICFRMDSTQAEWLIEDEGEGFDWTSVPNPFENDEEALNGRGIFLARYQFDELQYLGLGNRVRVIKRRVDVSGAGGSDRE